MLRGLFFGSTFLTMEDVHLRIGTWEKDVERNSSNWKKFENRVEYLECEGMEGEINRAMVFLETNALIVKDV